MELLRACLQVGESWRDEDCQKKTCDGPATERVEPGECAENAMCGLDENQEFQCLCNNGYEGNPDGDACTGALEQRDPHFRGLV